MAKTWLEKYETAKEPILKVIDKKFADLPMGTRMLIASPKLIDSYLNEVPYGVSVDVKTMRKDLALELGAENSCPVTTSIFLRVVAEVAYEKYQQGEAISNITPFWRVITNKMPIAKKLSCGLHFINQQRTEEDIN